MEFATRVLATIALALVLVLSVATNGAARRQHRQAAITRLEFERLKAEVNALSHILAGQERLQTPVYEGGDAAEGHDGKVQLNLPLITRIIKEQLEVLLNCSFDEVTNECIVASGPQGPPGPPGETG